MISFARQASVGFKKFVPSAVFLTLLSLFALPLSQSHATSFSTDLVGHWTFDDGGGPYLADSSGNGNTGSRENGVQFDADNAPTIFANDLSLSFDGTDDYVSTTQAISTTALTYSAWIKPTDIAGRHTILSNKRTLLAIHDGTLQWWADTDTFQSDGTIPVSAGSWYHVAVTETAGNAYALYVNGVLAGNGTMAAIDNGNPDTLYIGRYNEGSWYFKGLIDDVRIYDRALSAEEISVLAAEKSLVGYWKFDETNALQAPQDSSGLGYNGTNNGATITTDHAPTNFSNTRALSFDGVDDFVSLPIPAQTTPVTISLWAKPNTSDPVGMFDSAPAVTYVMRNYSAGNVDWWGRTVTLGLTSGEWAHLTFVLTYDGTRHLAYYKNGVFQAESDGDTDGTLAWTTFRLGNINGGAAGNYDGKLDDFRIYNRALSADEIADLAAGNHPEATWTGEHSMYYEDPNNWDTGVVPDPYSNVTIANAGARPMLTDDVSLSGLTINANASLDLSDKNLTQLDGGSFSNNGTLILDGSQTMTNFTNDVNSGQEIIRSSSNVTSFAPGDSYYNLRIEDPTENGLVGYWKLDEGSGSTTQDLSGNGNDGALLGGPTFGSTVGTTDFYNPRSLGFDGSNDRVTFPQISLTGDFTVHFWSNVTAGTIDADDAVIGKAATGNDINFYAGKLRLFNGTSDVIIANTSETGGTWRAYTLTRSGTSYAIYRDGVLDKTATASVFTLGLSALGAGNVYSVGHAYRGSLDDVRVYDRALSANEVMNLARGRYAAGSTGTATHTPASALSVHGSLNLDSGNLNLGAGAFVSDALSLLRGGGNLALGSSAVTIEGGITLSGATLTGGAGNLDALGNVSVLTGSLVAPSGNFSLYGNFSKTGGTFSHNNGTVTIAGGSTPTFRSGGAMFNTVDVDMPGIGVDLQDAFAADTLNLSLGGFRPYSNAVTVNILNMNGGNFDGGSGTADINRSLSLASGTFTAPSGLMTLSGSMVASIDGTFEHNNGRVILDSSSPASLAIAEPFNDLCINDGLVGYWNFDEPSGTSAADSSCYGNAGTLTSGPTISADVPDVNFADARSLIFDGVDDQVRTTTTSGLPAGSSPRTVSLWFKTTWGGSHRTMFAYGTATANEAVYFYVNNGKLNVDSYLTNWDATSDVNDGQWHHGAFTFDGTTTRIYVDGMLDGSNTVNAFNTVLSSLPVIGSDGRAFPGSLDDVRVYNRALSADEIARLAAGNQPATSISTATLGSALDVNGDLFLNAGMLDVSSSNYAVNVAGDWINNGGIFNERSGTVTLDGDDQSIPSTEMFYDLTKSVSSGATLTIGSGATLTVSNTVTLTGVSSNLLALRSSSDGHQWNINSTGTRTLAYLDAKDSNNISATPIMAGGLNIVNSGNLTNWIFDSTAPSVVSLSPADDAVDVSLTPTLVLTLDEDVVAASGKNILIKKTFGDDVIETIPADGDLVEIAGSVVTIRQSVPLFYGTSYYVYVESGAFEDAAGNDVSALASTTAWSFKVIQASSSGSSSSEEESSSVANEGGGGGRGVVGPGGRSTKAEAARQALLDRFQTQVASDETTIPPIGSSSRSSRPAIVKTPVTSTGVVVAERRGHLEVTRQNVAVVYKDVPVDAWFAPYVSLLIEEDIAQGYKDESGKPKGEFGVTNPVTYAEVAKMVLEAAGKDLKKAGTPRNASAKGTWASPYVALAESLRMSVYTPSLDVMKPATRGEVIQSILEAFGIPVKAKNIATFSDLPENHPHAQAIGVAYLYGLIDGDTNPDGTPKGTVRPDDQVNRAEVAKIIALALKLL